MTAPDRVAFVTGGSRGIGREIVVELARAGHPVAFCYASDEHGARETQAAVDSVGGKCVAVQADVTNADAVDKAFRDTEAAGTRDDEGAPRPHRERVVGERPHRPSRAGELRGRESRPRGADAQRRS
jgi:NAD(P)-dependent dehydrogenase (short-subunit alcohol dehydrogenase family)